jgi:hypothetical protein
MLKKILLFYILIIISLPAIATNNHVRVVLDISKSLSSTRHPEKGWPTDPKRLAILSTILLYDLAQPNPSLGDSFEVIPFDQNWNWSNEPPESKRPAIKIKPGEQRKKFISILNQLKYNGEKTYYYPSLLRAIEDLKNTPNPKQDIRTLVLVTDGLPEKEIRGQEAQLIRKNLIPLLEKHQIHLYILAFGKEAYKNQAFFNNLIISSDGINHLGEFLIDKDGDKLLLHMIKIFSSNFGFTFQKPQTLPKVSKLNLEGNIVPSRVAVIVYTNYSKKIPLLRLTPPRLGRLNAPDGIKSASEKGGSYSLQWVLSPNRGKYKFRTNINKGSVAILRPSNVELQVLPAPPDTNQTEWALAGKKQHFKVLVKSATGAKGDPGEVKLSYTPFGENIPDPLGQTLAPPPEASIVTQDGRIYDIMVQFPKHPQNSKKDYVGYLKLEAHRGLAKVGANQHRILIKASGIFYYTGGAIKIDLGKLGVDTIRCKPLIFKIPPQHQGEVDFVVDRLKMLPWGQSLEIRIIPGARVLKDNGNSLSVTPNEQFEVCLKTGENVSSSTAIGDKWLELRVKGSNEPEHKVPIQLLWQVEGLTFWQRWSWLIISILVLIALLILIIGILIPQRFSDSLAIVFVPEREDLDEQTPMPIKQWQGVGSGFFRNARAFFQGDYRISGKAQGALAGLYAENGGTKVKGNRLYRETLDGEWELVIQDGRKVHPGDIFRIGENGPYFRIAVRGR